MAAKLIGVDLSAAMLAQASRTGAYDALEKAELTAYLAAHPGAFDVVLSADTLCYFGALEEFAETAFAALVPGGTLAFSVEAMPEGEASDYRLQTNGRYVHNGGYVDRALAAAGLRGRKPTSDVLRTEQLQPVAVTGRPAADGAAVPPDAAANGIENRSARLERPHRLARRGDGDRRRRIIRQGDTETAEAIYRRVLGALPEHPDALQFLGVLLHGRGESREAVALLREAARHAPESAGIWTNLGNVLLGSGDADAADRGLSARLADRAERPRSLQQSRHHSSRPRRVCRKRKRPTARRSSSIPTSPIPGTTSPSSCSPRTASTRRWNAA